MSKFTNGRKHNIITVGEMSSTDIENCIKYSNPKEEELSMVFNFHHLIDWQLGMEEGQGWNALFWSNHDQPRIVSRFGDDEKYLVESAKMLGTAIHMLGVLPIFIKGKKLE